MPMTEELGVGGFALTAGQSSKLSAILEMLASDEHSPTTIRDPDLASRLHLADSLAALEIPEVPAASHIADLGSGAGFPGLPLAIALPRARVSLVESQRRKCEFLERVRDRAEIENVDVVCARAEEWSAGLGINDLVLARALAPQPVVLEYAAPLLRLGGTLVDWRGRRSPEEERDAAGAAELLGLQRREIHLVPAIEGATEHHLHVFLKLEETPDRFPRRAGMARKRPLR
jgi:16S rRNA (guanine527-N7)-methyltransferase